MCLFYELHAHFEYDYVKSIVKHYESFYDDKYIYIACNLANYGTIDEFFEGKSVVNGDFK